MNDDNSRQYYDDEIDLRQLFKSLKERSRFIFTFTGVVTLLAIGYVLSLTAPPTQYKVEASFLKPGESSVIRLNQYSLSNDTANTAESIFNKFLTTLNSSVLQKEVFIDGGYREKVGIEGESIVDVDSYISGFTKSISIIKNKETAGVVLPHILSTESSNPDVVSEFLDAILTKADKETINYFINTQKLKITNRLQEITTERQLLLTKSKQDRHSQIKRIKEADNQKLREINNKIDATRLIAKTERMNKIVTLKDAAALASSLNIIESNLNQLNKGTNNTNLNIAIQSGTNIPDWYLYGETALLKMIELLKSRESDDPYIPELALLDNQIKEINNNTLLQTLEQRLDDSPFITEISQLDIETIQLKSIRPDSTDINAMQSYQSANSEIIPTKSKNRSIIALSFIGSFMLSILLVFLMNAFKEEDVTSIQKGK
ncbi:Wzz/FepE/Etk N-terminal domain-containing protein [Candidatus Thioglobus sp.]|nr:Wzz/FepE/Etk N-terminal domain-containing protein [Candidatus Thioglobus sp.]